MLKISKQKIINLIVFICTYCVLLFFSGYYFFEYFATLGAIIILFLLLLLSKITSTKINKFSLIIAVLLILNIILTNIFLGFNAIQILLLSLSIVDAVLFTNLISIKLFFESYVKCMIIISTVSLIGNLLLIISPSFLSIFPKLINSSGRTGIFLLFSIVSDVSYVGSYRNQGIFWEPGAFQFFLVVAYFIELYTDQNIKRKKILLLLFLFSIFTTVSTTGIIVSIGLILLTISRSKNNLFLLKFTIIGLVFIFLIMLIIPKLSGYWKYTLVTKIDQVINYKTGISNQSSSRMDSIFYVFREFISSPLLGIGNQGFSLLSKEVGHSMFTCTPINLFAKFGLLFGAISYIGLWNYLKCFITRYFETITVFTLIILSVLSEEFSTNLFILILIFYGILYLHDRKNYNFHT